jgi:hypothetical protein
VKIQNETVKMRHYHHQEEKEARVQVEKKHLHRFQMKK